MIQIDSHFNIGSSHIRCEDYAHSVELPDKVFFAGLADGCSSSVDTDVGARLVVLDAIRAAKKGAPYHTKISTVTRDIVRGSGLHPTSLDATSLCLTYKEGARDIRASISGDGVVCARIRGLEDEWRVLRYTYSWNAPGYLNYCDYDNKGRLERFLSCQPTRTREHYYRVQGVRSPTVHSHVDFTLTTAAECIPFDVDSYDLVVVFSDGIESFRDSRGDEVPYGQVLTNLLNFKNYSGEFVTRRLRRFLKTCTKAGWTHYDDVSMAAIYVENP